MGVEVPRSSVETPADDVGFRDHGRRVMIAGTGIGARGSQRSLSGS
jgi:hypothetical protein